MQKDYVEFIENYIIIEPYNLYLKIIKYFNSFYIVLITYNLNNLRN